MPAQAQVKLAETRAALMLYARVAKIGEKIFRLAELKTIDTRKESTAG